MRKKVFVLRGGLGNQLYIYSKFLEFTKKSECILVFYPRQLHSFKYQDNLNYIYKNLFIFGWQPGRNLIYRFITDWIVRLLQYKILSMLLRIDLMADYYQDSLSRHSIDQMASDFSTLANLLSPENVNFDCSLGVHVRRGDYVGNNLYYPLNFEWYVVAIREMIFKYKVCRIFIVSNDIEWCKNSFQTENYFFCEHEIELFFLEDTSACNDLVVLAKCNYLILSNSTFSHWAYIFSRNLGVVKEYIKYEKYYSNSAPAPLLHSNIL
jgi:hypothetical protein